jgi:hypothetical protein
MSAIERLPPRISFLPDQPGFPLEGRFPCCVVLIGKGAANPPPSRRLSKLTPVHRSVIGRPRKVITAVSLRVQMTLMLAIRATRSLSGLSRRRPPVRRAVLGMLRDATIQPARFGPVAGSLGQCCREIGNQIVRMLDPHRNSQRGVGNSRFTPGGFRHGRVAH